MAEVHARAREMLQLLERGDVSAASALFSERIRGYIDEGWSLETYLRDKWAPGLDDLAGSPRRIIEEARISPTASRFTLEGDRGRAFVTIPFDDDGGVGGIGIDREPFEGIDTIVIACPEDRREEVSAFYSAILGDDRWRVPRLGFGEADEYRAPRWGDPGHPQQLHLDIFVRDLRAAEELVLGNGATPLLDAGDHRSYADPIGHAFCFYPTASSAVDVERHPGVLGRIVIDCFSPRALAPFYEVLLGMSKRIEDSAQRVVISRGDDGLPMLAFQHVSPFVAPRWPDPAFPQQMHFDLAFDDRGAAMSLVERLGAMRLPDQGGSCPVYADPSGHPFCLCMHGQ